MIDTATDAITGTIPVGGAAFPVGVAASPDGSKIYVSDDCVGSPCAVAVISTLSQSVIATVPVLGNPSGSSATPDGRFVYVANNDSNNVFVISAANNTVTNTITVGNNPVANGIFIQPVAPAPTFAGIPGQASCHGQSVAALARQFRGIDHAATTLGFSSVKALEDAIHTFCGA